MEKNYQRLAIRLINEIMEITNHYVGTIHLIKEYGFTNEEIIEDLEVDREIVEEAAKWDLVQGNSYYIIESIGERYECPYCGDETDVFYNRNCKTLEVGDVIICKNCKRSFEVGDLNDSVEI